MAPQTPEGYATTPTKKRQAISSKTKLTGDGSGGFYVTREQRRFMKQEAERIAQEEERKRKNLRGREL